MKFISNADEMRAEKDVSVNLVTETGAVTNSESLAAAKSVSTSGSTKFLVRASKRQRRLYNPIVDKIDQKSVIRTELEFDFQDVSKDCYDSYIEYLKTRNSYMLTKAELFAKR
jgi:hypothetical protein